jgi:predicted GNAT family N-acyltransferase
MEAAKEMDTDRLEWFIAKTPEFYKDFGFARNSMKYYEGVFHIVAI